MGPLSKEPAGSRSVEIRPFANRTLEPRISEYVNGALRRELQRDGTYTLETHGDGNLILSGEITRYERNVLAYTTTDIVTPQDYVLKLYAQITLVDRSTGKTNVCREVSGRTAIRIGSDLNSIERQAMPLLAEDLARNAISAVADTPW